MLEADLVAHVYVDGFAFYRMSYRCPRNVAHATLEALDLVALSRALLPGEDVGLVRHHTARGSDTPEDAGRAARQDIYLRALATLPERSILQGQSHTNEGEVRLIRCPLASYRSRSHGFAGTRGRMVPWPPTSCSTRKMNGLASRCCSPTNLISSSQ